VIFLSDGEDDVRDEPIFDICSSAVRSMLFFFGRDVTSSSLRGIAQISWMCSETHRKTRCSSYEEALEIGNVFANLGN
jgi:hypothetical protein